MTGPGHIPGQYNIIVAGEYENFEHQMPIKEFLQRLKNDDVPDEVSVVGLEKVFEDEEFITELAREMDQRADDLEYQSPTIQFVVEGNLQGAGDSFEVEIDDEFYSLRPIFGRQIKKRDSGWLVAPFRI